jgi:hypothetical protein
MVVHSAFIIQEKGLPGLKELRFHYVINLNMRSSVHRAKAGMPEMNFSGETHSAFNEKCVNALSGIQ